MRWHEILNELTDKIDFTGTIVATKGDQFDKMRTGGGGGQKPPEPPRRRDDRPERPEKKFIIHAVVASDDRSRVAHFEALDYFEICTDAELMDLMKCRFRSDYPADDVAYYCEMHNPEVEMVLDYARSGPTGFEVAVSEDDAMVWITHYRPHIVDPDWDHFTNGRGQS